MRPSPTTPDDPRCFANHMGYWLCHPMWLAQAVAHIRAGTWKAMVPAPEPPKDGEMFARAGDVAVIRIDGPIMKGLSKFGGTSSLLVRRGLREAVADEDVSSILLHVDSPGGHVAGTQDLADDVRRAAKAKPVHAHIDDMGASAALWAVAHASRVTANATAEIGSVGVMGVLEDSSQLAEREGIKIHVVATGEFKGMGFPGTEVSPEHLEAAGELVRDIFSHFRGALRSGRGMDAKAIDAVSDGRVHIARKAKDLGLIDEVRSFDSALADLAAPRRRKAAAAHAELEAFSETRHRTA